jgi:glycosyltransferase involved in cell wall biosynthesis
MANTANLFAENGEQITLVLLADTAKSVYPLHKNIRVIQLPLTFGITQEGNIISRKIKMLADIRTLRKTLKELKPSLLICSEYPYAVAAIIGRTGNATKIVSWEHTHFNVNFKNAFWRKLFGFTYPKLDTIVCLNKDEKELFKPINENVTVIPNFIQPSIATSALQNKVILTVARLTAVKGITHLLQTAKIVLQQHPDWQWKIIGDGELKNEVVDFIKQEKLQQQLILQEPVNHNIQAEYQNASLYVMTSINECFPMVLLEALSNGLPCIAFDCDTGPRNIITHNKDGLLVEKEKPVKLAEAISSLISNEEQRKKMGTNAIENIKRFSPETIYQLWKNEVFT